MRVATGCDKDPDQLRRPPPCLTKGAMGPRHGCNHKPACQEAHGGRSYDDRPPPAFATLDLRPAQHQCSHQLSAPIEGWWFARPCGRIPSLCSLLGAITVQSPIKRRTNHRVFVDGGRIQPVCESHVLCGCWARMDSAVTMSRYSCADESQVWARKKVPRRGGGPPLCSPKDDIPSNHGD
jgi:hypothetical protein